MSWEFAVFLFAIAGVTVGCLLPTTWMPLLPHDKWLHFLAFGGMMLLAARMAPTWPQLQLWAGGLLAAGFLIEVLQKLVPGRSFCWRDMGANAAGIATATALAMLYRLIG